MMPMTRAYNPKTSFNPQGYRRGWQGDGPVAQDATTSKPKFRGGFCGF